MKFHIKPIGQHFLVTVWDNTRIVATKILPEHKIDAYVDSFKAPVVPLNGKRHP